MAAAPALAALARDREERHEGEPLLAAGAQDLLGAREPGVDAEAVLHADDRDDRLRLRELLEPDVGHAQICRTRPASRSSARAPKCSPIEPGPEGAQVDQVEVVTAELAQVLLHLAAQLLRGRPGQPPAGGVTPRADLGGDHEVVRVGRERAVDELVGRAQRRRSRTRRCRCG